MEKISLERFREIKNRIAEIMQIAQDLDNEVIHLSDEEVDKYEAEIQALIDELKQHDLSDIPFEEYTGLFDVGFDFEGTGANLDFALIDFSQRYHPIRVKGCNIRNIDFENVPYDDDSYDREIRDSHSEYFLDESIEIDPEIRKRFYSRQLTLQDIITTDLKNIPNIQQRLNSYYKDIAQKIGYERCLRTHPLVFKFFGYSIHRGENIDITPDISEEEYTQRIRSLVVADFENSYLSFADSENAQGLRELASVYAPEYVIDFPEDKEDLQKAYSSSDLTLKDVLENPEIFRGKKYLHKFNYYDKRPLEYGSTTEKEIDYFTENFDELRHVFGASSYMYAVIRVIDVNETKETNLEAIKQVILDILKEDNERRSKTAQECFDIGALAGIIPYSEITKILSPYNSERLARVLESVTPKEFRSYNLSIKTLVENSDLLNFFDKYGLKTIMDFDRENGGFFSNNDFAIAKIMYENFIHYAPNQLDPDKNIFTKNDPNEEYYTREEFEESLVRIIKYSVTSPKFAELNYGALHGSFRDSHPDLFLPEEAPEELKKKFYSRSITEDDLAAHTDWLDFLEEKDLNLFMEYLGATINNYESIYNLLQNNMTTREALEFLIKNRTYMGILRQASKKSGYMAARFDHDVGDKIDIDSFEKEIMDNTYKCIISTQLTYDETMPEEFREAHPDLFLSDKIPEDIKAKFYSGTLSLADLYGRKELLDEFSQKAIIVGLRKILSNNYNLYFGNASEQTLLQLFIEYGEYYEGVNDRAIKFDGSIEETKTGVEANIEQMILTGKLKYNDEAPAFMREKHPELFLDENAPQELKEKFYTRAKGTDTYKSLTLIDLVNNEEYLPYLKGKSVVACNNIILSNLGKYFTIEEIVSMGKIDLEAMALYGQTDLNAAKLRRYLDQYAQYFPKHETDIISCPGFVLYFPEEKITEFNFGEYKDLYKMSNFKASPSFRRDLAEQIIATMYAFLGYGAAKDMLQLPTITQAELEELIISSSEQFYEIYQESYFVEGNLKVTNALFDKLAPLAPGKKSAFSVYKTLNQKLEERFHGSLEELITQCLKENNLPVDANKIKAITSSVIATHASAKRDVIRDTILDEIGRNIQETPENRKILIDNLNDALRKSFLEKENIDIEYIRSLLTAEFSRLKEDGRTFYSPHVTDHLEDLIKLCEKLKRTKFTLDPDKSVIDILADEREKIGQGWIRKLLDVPDSMSLQELQVMQERLYGDKGFTITTTKRIDLRDKSEQGQEAAFKYLSEHQHKDVLTFDKGERMFVGLSYPYSENFRKFFIEHKDEIISNPKYYTKIQDMNLEFERIISDKHVNNRFRSGEYTLEELLIELENVRYPGVKEGELDLEYFARKSGLEMQYFVHAQRIFSILRTRESQSIPPEQVQAKRFRGRILRVDDPLHIFIGKITTCCQRLGEGQPGESSMIHSSTERNGALFIVEEIDENGDVIRPVAQSWTWRNGNRICFDNVEIPDTIETELSASGAHDEIFAVYQEAARRMIETDTKAMKALLKQGKITQEQYDSYVLQRVTMGTGCDDLIRRISSEKRKELRGADEVLPLEKDKLYTGVNTRNLYTDAHSQYELASNPEATAVHKAVKGEAPIDYRKIREVHERSGKDIHSDIINKVRAMCEKSGRASVLDNMNITEYAESLDRSDPITALKRLTMHISENEDWFMFVNETDESVEILDSLIVTDEETKSKKSEIDKKMAVMEYHQKLCQILRKAAKAEKTVKLDLSREGTFMDLSKLVESGEISLSSAEGLFTEGIANVTVTDLDKLDERLVAIQKAIDEQREERIVTDVVKE